MGYMGNHTGSTTLTLWPSDIRAMRLAGDYKGWMPPVAVKTHDGTVQRHSLFIEIQLLDPCSGSDELVPLSDWILEHATVVEPEGLGSRSVSLKEQGEEEEDGSHCRLSGGLMRNHFYFATAPGNEHLYIATKKHNLYRELPSVG